MMPPLTVDEIAPWYAKTKANSMLIQPLQERRESWKHGTTVPLQSDKDCDEKG